MPDAGDLERIVKPEPAFFVYLRTFTTPESDLDRNTPFQSLSTLGVIF